MVTVDEFSRLVSGIYTAAVSPQYWESALREIDRTFGATGAALLWAGGGFYSVQNEVPSPKTRELYLTHYHQIDHVVQTMQRGPVGEVRTGTELVFPSRNSEFYADWLRPNEIEDGLFVRLNKGPRPTCFMMHTASRSDSFDTPDRLKLMGGLVVHLQQALRTHHQLVGLAQNNAEFAAALDVVRHGVVIVGSDAGIIKSNIAAEKILCAEDGVHSRSGRIAAASAHSEHELHHAIHTAVADDGINIRGGRSFTCPRPSGKRPYVIHVLPLHRDEMGERVWTASALVLIVDPERDPEPSTALLRRLYALTKTEADVTLRIMRGADAKQISDELSVSLPTIRTHIQHVLDKTDTHRQTDLVRLLMTLNP